MAKAISSKDTVKARRKYLTEIKELPPTSLDEEERETEEKDSMETKSPAKLVDKAEKEKNLKVSEKDASIESPKLRLLKKNVAVSDDDEGEVKGKLPFSSRDIILSAINLISLVLLLIILNKLPEKAKELNDLKVEQIKNESSVSFEFGEIEASEEKAERLEELFLDEAGIVNFVNEIEQLKGEGSAVSKISFASQDAVKDKTGNFGVPVVIELYGNWDTIGRSIRSIQSLPFIFRAAVVDISLDKQNVGMVKFEYGGFLYVKDRLGKN